MSRTLSCSKGNVGFLWKCCIVKGPPQAFREKFLSLPGVVAGNTGFHRLVTVTSGCFSGCLLEVRNTVELGGASRDPLGLVHRKRASFRVEAGSPGFVSCSNVVLGLCMPLQTGRQVSMCVEAWNSAFQSSCQRGFRPPAELNLGPGALFRLESGASELPLCC